MRNFHLPGRSNVLSTKGIAATSHPLATLEAISILKNGGNAIDAAIAASAVLAVVEPNATGVGGDCFAIVAPKGKNPISYNGSGISPQDNTILNFQKHRIKSIELESPHAVTIPGAIHAWSSIHADHGKLDFERLFLKAIEYAEEGFNVTERVSLNWKNNIKKLNKNNNSKAIFLKNGKHYSFGDIFKNQALANTLKKIGKNGAKEFYEGGIAKDIVKTLNDLGGFHTLEDFSKQTTIKEETIKSNYQDLSLHQCPPNGPGITVLFMMKIIENFDLNKFKAMSFERFHIEAEITKLAFKFREENIADPNFNEINLDTIMSKKNINDAINSFSMNKCCDVGDLNIPAHPETTYLTVIDKDLNSISFINSICYVFGGGITTNSSGILLQNRGTNFRLEENHINSIGSLKRPLHTIIPGMVLNNKDHVKFSYGVMGGQFQPVGHVHFLNNVIDYKMSVQESLDFPRAFHYNNLYQLELGIDQKLEESLKKVGHNTFRVKEPHGGGQAIEIDWEKGDLIGGSDSRKDGCAIGL